MYAIIRAGGKQAKVHEGDVIDIERVKGVDELTFTPLLIVKDDGTVISDRGKLQKAKVVASVVGEHRGEEDHREHEVDAVRESLAQVADVLGGDRLLAGVSGEPGRSESEEHRQEDAGPYDRSSPAVTSPCRVHQDAHGVPGDGFQ